MMETEHETRFINTKILNQSRGPWKITLPVMLISYLIWWHSIKTYEEPGIGIIHWVLFPLILLILTYFTLLSSLQLSVYIDLNSQQLVKHRQTRKETKVKLSEINKIVIRRNEEGENSIFLASNDFIMFIVDENDLDEKEKPLEKYAEQIQKDINVPIIQTDSLYHEFRKHKKK